MKRISILFDVNKKYEHTYYQHGRWYPAKFIGTANTISDYCHIFMALDTTPPSFFLTNSKGQWGNRKETYDEDDWVEDPCVREVSC